MNTNDQFTSAAGENEAMEDRLWEYIDGRASGQEKTGIEKLLESNLAWKNKYHELLELNQLLASAELEQPSLRFAKNVMEQISKYHIAPATKTYINKKVIWGIAAFLITMIIGFLIYGFGQIDWNIASDRTLPVDLTKVDFGKFFNNTYTNVFMMINVVLGLFLLDRYLANRKNKIKEA